MKAYTKDILKTITKGKKRFLALMLITALGVCMQVGLKAACDDLRVSADTFFDQQNLFDISIVSTMGLTEEDVRVLSRIGGIEEVEGSYNETVFVKVEGQTKQADVRVLSENGINEPYLIEGEMPMRSDEILVTKKYLSESGKTIGDKVVIEEKIEEAEDEEEDEKDEEEYDPFALDLEKPYESSSDRSEFDQDDVDIEVEEEEDTPNFLVTEYTIVGSVVDVTDVNSTEGGVSFRNTSTTDYTFFVRKDAVDSDIFTTVYITLTGADELYCYSDEYEARVDDIVTVLEEEIKADREKARYEAVTGEALDKVDEAEAEMYDKFYEAEVEIIDAKIEIEDGWSDLLEGEDELADGEYDIEEAERKLAKAERELEKGERELDAAKDELDAAWDELEAGETAIEEGEDALDEAEVELDEAEEALPDQFSTMRTFLERELDAIERDITTAEAELLILQTERDALQAELDTLTEGTDEYTLKQAELTAKQAEVDQKQSELDTYNEQKTTYEETLADLDKQEEEAKQEIADGRVEIANNRAELAKSKQELADGRVELEKAQADYDAAAKEIEDGWKEFEDGWDELEKAYKDIKEGKLELADGKAEFEDGKAEYEESVNEYKDKKQEAIDKIEEAREEIADLKMTSWYITTRTGLSGYSNVETDAACIESIGNAFPILFLTVAILISLTTISRMVEEDRGLIGTYKALGFTDREIRRKYVVYAFFACIFGGILGNFFGFVVLPEIIFTIFGIMYELPAFYLTFDAWAGVGAIVLFIAGIVGAAFTSCNAALSHMPAVLMRPKAPKNGSRVLLERITPIWSRLSFLNKVTARNLFRYKKRLFMTLFGIAGCTSILLAGYTIKDTITEMMPLQFEKTSVYDLMVVSNDNEKLLEYIDGDTQIRSYINPMISNVNIVGKDGREETVQLIVVPETQSLRGYFNLYDEADNTLRLEDGDVFTTINVSNVLDYGIGDTITIQTLDLDKAEVEVTGITMNYLSNYMFMTEATYKELFDDYEANSIIALLSIKESAHEEYADELSTKDGILSAVASVSFGENFDQAFQVIDLVVTIVITLAAALAFVVLFTLSTTNISERERELATIKVLGFFDKEVHLYVNKETLILTTLGIFMGMPIGKVFGIWLMSVLKMPSIHFADTLYPISYLIAGVMALAFAFIVNFITDRSLDKINPVEALKSVE